MMMMMMMMMIIIVNFYNTVSEWSIGALQKRILHYIYIKSLKNNSHLRTGGTVPRQKTQLT